VEQERKEKKEKDWVSAAYEGVSNSELTEG
jgi:hypothetical protein